MIHEEHIPRKGFVKVWPISSTCPICNDRSIVGLSTKPMYIRGENVCIYVDATCYNIVNKLNVESVEEAINCYNSLMEHR